MIIFYSMPFFSMVRLSLASGPRRAFSVSNAASRGNDVAVARVSPPRQMHFAKAGESSCSILTLSPDSCRGMVSYGGIFQKYHHRADSLVRRNLLQHSRFSSHPYKPKSREIFRPNIPGPESFTPPNHSKVLPNPLQHFVPVNHYLQMKVESLRSGEDLGEDYPWNLLPWKYWRRRKYNVEVDHVPWSLSQEKGVGYHKRLNVWTTQWTEDGVHRIRRFRAAFGLVKAKRSAEKFRRDLEASGRVDNRQTAKQRRQKYIQKREELKLRKRRFAKIASGQF